jgi:hypothetical protein
VNTINVGPLWPVRAAWWLASGLAVLWTLGTVAAFVVIVTRVHPFTAPVDEYGDPDGEGQFAAMIWAVFLGAAGLANLVPAGLWTFAATGIRRGRDWAWGAVLAAALYSCLHAFGLGTLITWWPGFPVIAGYLATLSALGILAAVVRRRGEQKR